MVYVPRDLSAAQNGCDSGRIWLDPRGENLFAPGKYLLGPAPIMPGHVNLLLSTRIHHRCLHTIIHPGKCIGEQGGETGHPDMPCGVRDQNGQIGLELDQDLTAGATRRRAGICNDGECLKMPLAL